ncbi:hypothetical protein K8I85_09495 [bacterium]|nr:hypothetical protein [bacterium]
MARILPVLLLNGRPAAGKSEIIDYLKSLPAEERARRFRIGEIEELDDFPILWERFEDDDIYERNGRERVYSDTTFSFEGQTYEGYVFKDRFFWDFLLQKLSFEYEKRLRRDPDFHETKTMLIEFSRGAQHGGWAQAYPQLSDAVLERAATIYIDVPWEESLRRNRRRFNPDRPDSILEHSLESRKLEMLYRDSDWEKFSARDPHYLHVRHHRVPFAVFRNDPEITDQPNKLGDHLQELMQELERLGGKIAAPPR